MIMALSVDVAGLKGELKPAKNVVDKLESCKKKNKKESQVKRKQRTKHPRMPRRHRKRKRLEKVPPNAKDP